MEKKSDMLKSNNPPQKKKSHKRRTIAIIIFIILLIAAITTFVIIKLNFLTKDEIHIELTPLQKIIYTNYNKPINLDFKIKNNNFWFCNAKCDFSLKDTYSGLELDSRQKIIKSNAEETESYPIYLDTRGVGQRIYNFEVSCNNMKTFLCRTNEEKTHRTSFVSINYNLPTDEESMMNRLKSQLNNYSMQTDDMLNLIEELNQIKEYISKIKTTSISTQDLETKAQQIKKMIPDINLFWVDYNFEAINNIFSQKNLDEIESIKFASKTRIDTNLNDVTSYNLMADISNSLLTTQTTLNDSLGFYLATAQRSTMPAKIINESIAIKSLLTLFYSSGFEDSIKLKDKIAELNTNNSKIISSYYSDLSSFKDNTNSAVLTNFDRYSRLETIRGNNLSINRFLIDNSSNVSFKVKDGCDNIKKLVHLIDSINNATLDYSTEYEDYTNRSEFNSILGYYENMINYQNITINYDSKIDSYVLSNNNTIYNALNLTPNVYTNLIMLDYSELVYYDNNYCENFDYGLSHTLSLLEFDKIDLRPYEKKKLFDFQFDDIPKKCCIFNRCDECRINSTNYPIIFLHGHSFNKDNAVESSLMAFYKMQKKLSEDGLYINAGDIDITTTQEEGLWSMMDIPLSVRASFYYIVYYDLEIYTTSSRKDESIESYAIRLKELVDIVKWKTGSDKVNIVAHSMGGLVARDYIILFGEKDVNKLIMIGTPNYGIVGDTQKYCKNFGSNKECEDLYKDSIFLKKLNERKNIPKIIPVYDFYGSGCNMQGKDGDGVIASENAALDWADNFQINGTCTGLLKVNLHGDMLDPQKYPQVYEKVKELLRG